MGQVPRLGQRVIICATRERAEAYGQNREATPIRGGGRRVSRFPSPLFSFFLCISRVIDVFERNDSEIVEVPEDSADAKRWPLWKPPTTDGRGEAADAPKNGDSSSSNAPIPIPTLDTEALPPTSSSSSPVAATAQPQSHLQTQKTTTTTTTTKRPGRRKPKTQLAELPSASSQKGKKLTTLEKSALDWKGHVHSSGAAELASELEANRRGGGYLEKVEFLQRVGDRKNEALEANRDQKRRRG